MTNSSEIFSSTPYSYMRQVIKTHLAWVLILYCIAVAGVSIASFHDLRWAFVALIMIFIIFPIIVFNAYFFYLLTPEARKAIGAKKVTFDDDGSLELSYFKENEEGDWTPSGETEKIEGKRIKYIKSNNSEIIIGISDNKPGFILIPKDALSEELINRLIDNKEQF